MTDGQVLSILVGLKEIKAEVVVLRNMMFALFFLCCFGVGVLIAL